MRSAFGYFMCVQDFAPARVDPSKPDPRARREMAIYDALAPEVRAAFANSLYGVQVEETVANVTSRGASDPVKRALKERGLFPCDVGTEGVVVETVRIADEYERRRIASELAS